MTEPLMLNEIHYIQIQQVTAFTIDNKPDRHCCTDWIVQWNAFITFNRLCCGNGHLTQKTLLQWLTTEWTTQRWITWSCTFTMDNRLEIKDNVLMTETESTTCITIRPNKIKIPVLLLLVIQSTLLFCTDLFFFFFFF